MIKRLLMVVTALFLIGCGGSDDDAIKSVESMKDGSFLINLNAVKNGSTGPVTLALKAGDYKITPISSHYSSWMAYSSIADCYTDERCIRGWSNRYQYSTYGNSVTNGDDGFKTPELAFANATSSTFFLGSDTDVLFLLFDSIYDDNQGGMSLKVENISVTE